MGEYTDQQKREAVELSAVVGQRQASRQLKIPLGTISGWIARERKKPEGQQITLAGFDRSVARRNEKMARKREQITDLVVDNVIAILKRVNAPYEVVSVIPGGRGQPGQVQTTVLDKPPAADVKAFMIAAAVGIDKIRQEMGDASQTIDVNYRHMFGKIWNDAQDGMPASSIETLEGSVAEGNEEIGELVDEARSDETAHTTDNEQQVVVPALP